MDVPSHLADHQKLAEPSRYAAVVVAHILDRWIEAKTVLDLGCGTGTWLRGFAAGGRREVLGVEGELLDPQYLEIDADLILHADLAQPLNLHRRFDLVICLEVAEHIAADAAGTVVENCIRHGDIVLFSAALPGQQGRHHINEQLPEYWVTLFRERGYVALDLIRPRIWNDKNIPFWYRQNTLLFVRRDIPILARLQIEAGRAVAAAPLNRVHPDLLVWVSHEAELAKLANAEATSTNLVLRRSLAESNAKLTSTNAKLTSAKAELERTANSVASLQQEREVILNSTLWRMTGPLRRAGQALPTPVRRTLRRVLHQAAGSARRLRPPKQIAAAPHAARRTDSRHTTGTWRIVIISGEPHIPGHLYRVVRFADAATALGATVLSITMDEAAAHRRDVTDADFVIIWRAANTPEVAATIAAVRDGSGKLLVDIDDLMFVPELATEDIIDGIRTQDLDPVGVSDFFQRVRDVMAQGDACICTTNALAKHVRQLGKTTFVLPNGFDAKNHAASRLAVRRRRARQDDGLIRIGYATGTRTHQRDFQPAADSLARILLQYPACRLVLFQDPATLRPLLDLKEFPALEMQSAQIEWRDLVPLDALPDELARFDVNIAPLESGNPFCEAKSELKYFEAALAGICTVASPTDPMRGAIRHGETGLLADGPDGWYEALRSLVENADLRRRLAHAAYLDVLRRFGPHRRAEQVQSLLAQLTGGQDAARAFELEFMRGTTPAAAPPNIVSSDLVFCHDALGTVEVSVVVPLYNYADYVTEALESVRAQTLEPLDLIVVDDRSTDDSLKVVHNWAEQQAQTGRFNRIVIMCNRTNSGLARTRNVAFDAAETEYVVPLDADNRLLPKFCARTLQALRCSHAAFAYSKIQCFGGHDHVIGTEPFSPMQFAQANYVDAMALVAKWAWATVGGYTHIEHGWEDYDFWCSCVEHGIWGIHLPEILAEYRFHEASMLRTITDVKPNKVEVVQQLESRHRWLTIVDRG